MIEYKGPDSSGVVVKEQGILSSTGILLRVASPKKVQSCTVELREG